MSRPLGDLRPAAAMLDGIDLKRRCCVVALPTNPCESMIETVRCVSRNVKRRQTGDMRPRWTAARATTVHTPIAPAAPDVAASPT